MTPNGEHPLRQLNPPARLALVNTETGEAHGRISAQSRTREELLAINEQLKGKLDGYLLQIRNLQAEVHDKQAAANDSDDVRAVLDYWREKCAPRAKVVPASPRWKKVKERLKEGYSPHDLGDAVRGALLSKYHVEHNYLKAETIFRDSGTVDDHRERHENWCHAGQGQEHFFSRTQKFMREQGWHQTADAWLAQHLQDQLEAERSGLKVAA